MNNFKRIFLEASGIDSNLNLQRSPYRILEKYKDRDDIHISFRSVNKIGINPLTEHHTPLGIYAYPLKASWETYLLNVKEIDKNKNNIGEYFPYASHQPYIYILKEKSHMRNMYDISSFNDNKIYDEVINAINDFVEYQFNYKSIFKSSFIDFDRFYEYYMKYAEGDYGSDGSNIWAVTREISQETINQPLFWNMLLKDIAGFYFISDRNGEGIIHPNEPIQTLFLSTKAFDVVDVIINDEKIFDKRKAKRDEFYLGLEKAIERNDPNAFYNAVKKNLNDISHSKMTTTMIEYITLHNDNPEFLRAYKDFNIKIPAREIVDLIHARCYNMVEYFVENYKEICLDNQRRTEVSDNKKIITVPNAIDDAIIAAFISNKMSKTLDKFLEKTGIDPEQLSQDLHKKYKDLKMN